MDLLAYIASLLQSGGLWTSCITLPHCWGAVGGGSPCVHCHTAAKRWVVDLLKYAPTTVGSSGQWVSFCTPPHY